MKAWLAGTMAGIAAGGTIVSLLSVVPGRGWYLAVLLWVLVALGVAMGLVKR